MVATVLTSAVVALASTGQAPAQDVPLPDTDPPETSITEKRQTRMRFHKDGRGGENYATVKFRFSSSEPESSFACKLDKRPWEACTSPVKYKVGLGKHRFKVRATDSAGNADPTAAKRRFVVKPADGDGDECSSRLDCPGHGTQPG